MGFSIRKLLWISYSTPCVELKSAIEMVFKMMKKVVHPALVFLAFSGWIQTVSADVAPKVSLNDTKVETSAKLIGVESSAPSSASIAHILEGEAIEIRNGVGFAKLILYFEPALNASKVELESCSADFRDGVEFFALPGTRRVYAEGGSRVAKADFGSRLPDITSLAINLRGNLGPCLKALRFLNADGANVSVSVAKPQLFDRTILNAKEFDRNQSQFNNAGLAPVMNQELISESVDEEKWILRLRGDGTFFMFGRTDDMKLSSRFSAIGNYRIQETKKNRIRLLLTGYRLMTPDPWDGGWRCLTDCWAPLPSRAVKIEELIEIEKVSRGSYMIRNRSDSQRRTLHFSDIRVTTTSL